MKIRAWQIVSLLALCALAGGVYRAMRPRATPAPVSAVYFKSWNPQMAASYLNEREVWWQSWRPAQKDHGTICISCHTVVPYAMAWPALHPGPGTAMTVTEKTMLDSVEKRVANWSQMTPFYSDAADGPGKTAQSHATEAVLNAVILASYDAGQGRLRPITRTAFDEAWALQEKTGKNAGGWQWEDFDLAPWESKESAYQGAALLAVAAGDAPEQYASSPGVSEHLRLLQHYLRSQYAAQPVMSQLYVLWASARMAGLLDQAQQTKLLTEIRSLQLSDGGWDLSTLNQQAGWRWKWLRPTPQSDGCATALVVLALEESGIPPSNRMLERGLEWLNHHQEKNGSWLASSLNVNRNPETDVGRFMSDAATGYAVLALKIAEKGINRDGAL